MVKKPFVQLPGDIKDSLRKWAETQVDEDTPFKHVFGICCHRLGQLPAHELAHWAKVMRQAPDWTELFTTLGPPKD